MLIVVCLLTGCVSTAHAPRVTLHATEEAAWKMVDEGALLVDVRTEREYKRAHLEGALHIPFDSLDDKLRDFSYPKTTSIVVYSQEEHQAAQAQDIFKKHGFSEVVSGGSYMDLLVAKDMRD